MEIIGLIAALLLIAVGVFQILVAMGLPHADMIMGGRFEDKLPKKYKFIVAINGLTLFVFAYVFALKSGLLTSERSDQYVNIVTIIITVFLFLNTFSNLASKSKKERWIMTPISAICAVFGLILLLS